MLRKYIISLPIAFFVFLLTYIIYFLQGHSLRAFLGVQKWIVTFYANGAKGTFITPWEMIVTGKWHTWWGTYTSVDGWHVGWVLLLLFSIYAIFLMIKIRYKKQLVLFALWVPLYLLFLSAIPTWPRYLLLVLPFMYTLSIWVLRTQLGKKLFTDK